MTVEKNIVGTKYVPNGLQTMAFRTTDYESLVSWQGLGISTLTARQHQSRDVEVGDNPTAGTFSFGKEIEEHAMQQGSARVNNGMQQVIGELAVHSCPLERKGNQAWNAEGNPESLATGPQTSGIRIGTDSVGGNRAEHVGIGQNTQFGGAKDSSYGNGESVDGFRERGS
ncbi:hypothetical protein R3P38DRAFT_2814574 [Favolaschia claudopus]|uniref:Uncharacterized protein n=1 Tax=Favolaschia claudopus TaxID=2862362 RepID=A0AAV9Z4U0_9AGAR